MFYVDVETALGVKCGAGPITRVIGFRRRRALDQVSEATLRVAALPEYQDDDPGVNQTKCKVRFVYDQEDDINTITVIGLAQVSANPNPSVAKVQVYVSDGGVDTAGNVQTITDFGSYGKLSVAVDVSGLTDGLHYVEIRIVWESSGASGTTAKIKWLEAYAR